MIIINKMSFLHTSEICFVLFFVNITFPGLSKYNSIVEERKCLNDHSV